MSASCEDRTWAPQKMTFRMLAQQVLSLDAGIEWMALEEAGRGPHWAWREPSTGNLCSGATKIDYEVVDPLLLLLADHPGHLNSDGTIENPDRVRFIVLAYTNMMQIVARLHPNAHVVVALAPGIDPHLLGRKLVNLLEWAIAPGGLQ